MSIKMRVVSSFVLHLVLVILLTMANHCIEYLFIESIALLVSFKCLFVSFNTHQ